MSADMLRTLFVVAGVAGFFFSGATFIWSTKFLNPDEFEKHFSIGKWSVLAMILFGFMTIMGSDEGRHADQPLARNVTNGTR